MPQHLTKTKVPDKGPMLKLSPWRSFEERFCSVLRPLLLLPRAKDQKKVEEHMAEEMFRNSLLKHADFEACSFDFGRY